MQQPNLNHKRILLGVTGGIAAYRAADVVRRLRDQGADVRVVMTQNATRFISSLTMQAISGNDVRSDLFDEQAEMGMGHIELARWADTILIAPASAGFIARLAHGFADDLLTTMCLATESPVVVAPAMNRVMWASDSTQENVSILKRRGVNILGPGVGDQACGETGPGRMLMPEEIVEDLISFSSNGLLSGVNVLVTAGSTWEAIDPVRGITNRSSGKMGYAIANAATRAGASVILVSGPVSGAGEATVDSVIKVTSACEMLDAVLRYAPDQDVFVSVAAVADYRPAASNSDKIKKKNSTLPLELIRNPDILTEVKKKYPSIFAVGFAAETSNVIPEAKKKLLAKGMDLIAANNVAGDHGAIGSDTNTIELIDRRGVTTLGPALKTEIAEQMIGHISSRYYAQGRLQDSR